MPVASVTVAICTWNGERFIGESLRSVLSQEVPDLEVIVVDDHSVDATVEVVRSMRDPRVTLYENDRRLGIPGNWNRALSLARGQYVCLFHQDDRMRPGNLAQKIALLERDPEIGLVHSGITVIVDPTAPSHIASWVDPADHDFVSDGLPYLRRLLLEGNLICAPAVVARRADLLRAGGFPPEFGFAGDYVLWMRVCLDRRIGFLREPLVEYRWHAGNETHRYRFGEGVKESYAARLKVLEEYRQRAGREPEADLLRAAVEALMRVSRWAADLAEAREWLEAQVRSWQAEAEQRDRTIAELRGWIGQLEASKSWLEGHRLEAVPHPAAPQRQAGASVPQPVAGHPSATQGAATARSMPTDDPGWLRADADRGKIVVLMEVRSLDTGGLEEAVFNLARSLDRDRFDVWIVCVEGGGQVARRCRELGIPVEVLGTDKQTEYSELLARHQVDLVCTHYSLFGAPLAAAQQIPVVSVIHNLYTWLPDGVFSELKSYDRFVSRYVAVSDPVARYLCGRFNIPPERVSVIPNGLDVEALAAKAREPLVLSRRDFGLSEDDYLFLHVAAITEVKGHNALVRAMKDIVREHPRIKVLCVGPVLSQGYADVIRQRVTDWGLDGHVRFTGFVERITDLYRLADAFVLPSIVEGWSLAAGEAMFFGLPVVLTRTGGAETLITEDDIGRLIAPAYDDLLHATPEQASQYAMEEEPRNAPALIQAMIDMYQRRAFWQRAGGDRRAKILRDHTLHSTARRYEHLFLHEIVRASRQKARAYQQWAEQARSLDEIHRRLTETHDVIGQVRRGLDDAVARADGQWAEAVRWLDEIHRRLTETHDVIGQVRRGLDDAVARADAQGRQLADLAVRQQAGLAAAAETLSRQLADMEARQQARLDALAQHILDRLSLTARLRARVTSDLCAVEELLRAAGTRIRAHLRGARSAVKAWLPFGVRHRLLSLYYWLSPEGRPITHARGARRGRRAPLDGAEAYRRRVEQIATLPRSPAVGEARRAAVDRVVAESRPERIAIYPPTLIWGERLFQRPQQIFRALARRGLLAVYCSASPAADRVDGLRQVAERLYLCSDIALLRGLDERVETILWMTRPDHRWYRELFPRALSVYEMIDELEVFPEYCEAMERDHLLALAEADVVVATARRLHDRIRPIREDVVLAPNGVCLEDFQNASRPDDLPGDLARIVRRGRPIIGYYGALAEWFDYDLLNACARACPDYSFVLIGPDYDGSARRLPSLRNVFWLGPKDYVTLKQYLRYFDVATIPFRITPITESTSPIKLFEYMAGGKPVVTTALPECRHYRSVLIGDSREGYIAQLAAALRKRHDPDYLRLLHQEAKENTWDARVDAILPLLADAELCRRYGIGRRFLRAVRRQAASNADRAMYDTWLDYALSTNRRGQAAIETIRRYTSLDGKRALDIGCAYGGFPVAFARAGARAVGIDIDAALIELAATNAADMQVPVCLHVKDITDWAHVEELGTFDIVTCNDLIEHVGDVSKTLDHVARVLEPGGVLYLQIPNAFSVGQVLRDGHYGLFGITLLARPQAIRYFHESGYADTYGVGTFLHLDEYLDLLAARGLHPYEGEIANSVGDLSARIDRVRAGLDAVRSGLSRRLDASDLSAETRHALHEAVSAYLAEVASELAAYDSVTDDAVRAQRGWSLVKRYEVEFWEVLCVKAA